MPTVYLIMMLVGLGGGMTFLFLTLAGQVSPQLGVGALFGLYALGIAGFGFGLDSTIGSD